MPLPWLQIIDLVVGVTDFARSRRARAAAVPENQNEAPQQLAETRGGAAALPGGIEARMASVVVAALKEAFDRDTRRLELERTQLEAERERADRALKLELLRQAGDREIGRLRLLAGVAMAAWIGTFFFSARVLGGSAAPRVALGLGWALLLGAIAASFTAQSHVAGAIARGNAAGDAGDLTTVPGALALWLIILGLALVGLAVLIA